MPFSGTLFNVQLPSKSVIVPLVVPFTCTVAPITGSPVASTTCPFTVPVCITVCTPFTSANTVCGLPANKAEAITVENKILLDENLKNSFFINLKFNINSFIVVFLLYTLFDKLAHLMPPYP